MFGRFLITSVNSYNKCLLSAKRLLQLQLKNMTSSLKRIMSAVTLLNDSNTRATGYLRVLIQSFPCGM